MALTLQIYLLHAADRVLRGQTTFAIAAIQVLVPWWLLPGPTCAFDVGAGPWLGPPALRLRACLAWACDVGAGPCLGPPALVHLGSLEVSLIGGPCLGPPVLRLWLAGLCKPLVLRLWLVSCKAQDQLAQQVPPQPCLSPKTRQRVGTLNPECVALRAPYDSSPC